MKNPNLNKYVICTDENTHLQIYHNDFSIIDFLKTNIGKIVEITENWLNEPLYVVYYEKVPQNLLTFFHYPDSKYKIFSESEIIYISENKKDLEVYINAYKYNL